MSNDTRRQGLALVVAATTAIVLTALVPQAGALEPLDDAAPVTTLVEEVLEQAAPVVGGTSTTTTSTTTTSTTSTTAPAPTTTTTAPPPPPPPATGAPQPTRGAPARASAPVVVMPDEAGIALSLPSAASFDPSMLPFGAGGFTTSSPMPKVLRAGARSTVDVMGLLQGVGAPPGLVAKVLAPFPVAGPANYSDDWGAPRHGGRRHQGTDIFAARGTPVIAAADGVVGRMTTIAFLGGTTLRVTAANGTFFYYAHLDRFAPGLTDGSRVTAGDVVGFIGNTGNAVSTPPHLHFEIHPGGAGAAPPVPYLDRWLAEARVATAAVVGAPAVDALVRPSQLRAALPAVTPGRRASGMATTSSTGEPPPIDPLPLIVLLLPAAWFARYGLRGLRAWRVAR